MAKDILLDPLPKMVQGLNKAAAVIGGTMGPKGRNVYLDDGMSPKIVNDGVTIANKILLANKQEDAGAYILRNVCSQQVEDCGDGTTTVAVLTHAIITECLKRPENAMEVKASLKAEGDKVLKQLAKSAVKLKVSDIEKVALISAEDAHIAKLVTQIIDKLGVNAVINVEDSKTFATDYEIVDGYEAHVGFVSPHFITDKKTARAIYQDVPIVVCERKIANIADIKPMFEMFNKEGITQAVFVVDEIDDSMLGILVQNKLMGTFNSLVVHANTWLAQDIAGATGATIIGNANGLNFSNFDKSHLGFSSKVVCNANTTLFTVNGSTVKAYANLLDGQASNDPNQFSAKKIRERAIKLRGGVAVLRIGAATDFERDYLRLKAEDSVKAVQAALAEGIVEGGGMALWRLAQGLKGSIGANILAKALQAPLRQILANAGLDYTEIGLQFNQDLQIGYDVKNNKFTDLISIGIIDPVKVTRCALENAISAASTFITTFALITDAPEPTTKN